MAIVQVQKKEGALPVDGPDITVTYDSTPREHNLILLKLSKRGSGTNVTLPSGWTLTRRETSNTTIIIAHKIAGAAESAAVTPTWTVDTGAAMAISEYSGILTESPSDVSAGASLENTTSLDTGNTADTDQAEELCIAADAIRDSMGAIGSWDNGFIAQDDIISTSATVASLAWSHRIVNAIGQYGSDFDWTTSQHASAVVVTFRGADTQGGAELLTNEVPVGRRVIVAPYR